MQKTKIRGHQGPINILLNSIETNRLASSYIFSGPEGIGKAAVAKYLAQILNCQKDNFAACGACSSCQKIESLNHPDVHWVSADDSGLIKIEKIRLLIQEMSLKPFEGRCKVFIILDAQNLTEEAANCLLKTLEEPPIRSLIILTTSKIKKLLPTIISRCQKINFSALNPLMLEEILNQDYNLPRDLSRYLSYSCAGSLGKSLKANNPNTLREKNRVIDDFLNLSLRGYSTEVSFVDRQRVREFLNILMQWFRDMLLLKSGADYSGLINLDRKNDLSLLKEKYSFAEIISGLKDIIRVNLLLEQNLNLKITLSLLKEKLCKG